MTATHALEGLKVRQLLENSYKALLLLIVDTESLVDGVELVTKLLSDGKGVVMGVAKQS